MTGHGHHPYNIAILVAKEGQGATAHRIGVGGFLSKNLQVFADLFVCQHLDVPKLFPLQGTNVGKVKAQALGSHQRPRLPHVSS